MKYIPSLLSLAYLLVGLFDLVIAYYCWRRRPARGAFHLSHFMIAVGFWSFTTMMENMAVGIPAKVFWSKISYLAVYSSPPLLLMFAWEITHPGRALKRLQKLGIWLIPILTMLLAMTNDWHNLIWTGFIPNPDTTLNLIVYEHGTWFWVALVYAYASVLLSIAYLVLGAMQSRKLYRRQMIALVASIPLVLLVNGLYVFDLIPIPGLDVSPLAFSLTGLALVFSFNFLHLFDLVPFAYKQLIESMQDGLIVMNRENLIMDVTPAAERIFSSQSGDLIGQPLAAIFKRIGITADTQVIPAQIDIHSTAAKRVYELNTTSLASNRSADAGSLILIHDISERLEINEQLSRYSGQLEVMMQERTSQLQQAEERLARSEQLAMLGQLAGSVSHELRNPLSTVSNALYFLKETCQDASPLTQEYLEMINQEIGKARKIITDLLDFSRGPISKNAQKELIHLEDFLVKVLAEVAVSEKIEVCRDIPAGLPPIHFDPTHLNQALTNLINNACQAMVDGGRLSVCVQDAGDNVRLSISDTGCGISPENLAKIFQPLFTTRPSGIGLGLPITRNLVEANGGTIRVESNPGKGTSIFLELPKKH